MKHTKKITILHSNDLHGDFLAEQVDEKLVGGVPCCPVILRVSVKKNRIRCM